MKSSGCVLITDDYLPHIGGSRLYCHRLASILAGRISVVTKWRPGSADFDRRAGYPVSRVRLRGHLVTGPAIVGEIFDAVCLAHTALGSFSAPGCYLAGEVVPSAFAAALAARRNHVPYGVILHDEPLSGAGRLEEVLRRWLFSHSGAIVVSSSFPERRARTMVGETVPIFRVPPGVDTEIFCPGDADADILGRFGVESGQYLLCVGRLVDYKNIQAVIRVLAHLQDERLALVIVGEGPEKPVLASLAKDLGVGERVVFAGRVETQRLVNLYRGALAYIFPSRRAGGRQHEGIGMAALEAAACGTAVVASSQTSAGDFIQDGHTGLIFDPGGEGALERAVREVLEAPGSRRRMALSCMKRVHRDFSWQAAARGMGRALAALAAARGR